MGKKWNIYLYTENNKYKVNSFQLKVKYLDFPLNIFFYLLFITLVFLEGFYTIYPHYIGCSVLLIIVEGLDENFEEELPVTVHMSLATKRWAWTCEEKT